MSSRAVQIACITLFAFCSKCINSAHADSFTDALAQQGRVYLHNNQAYAGLMAGISARLANDRLPNVAMIKRVLKPGGILGIVDHTAQPGSGVTFTQNLHRIDAKFARRDINNRGFEFLGSIEVLENPTDVLTESVFEPQIRGRTSRFVHKYRKH